MTPRDLLRILRDANVSVSLDGGRLRCSAPTGVLTPALRGSIEQHREALIRLLSLSAEQTPLPPRKPPLTPFPLSHAQQRIWFLDQLANANVAYVMPAAAYIRGPLNVPALQQALADVVARHAALRTRFAVVDGEPVQWEVPHVEVSLPVFSLEALPGEDPRALAEQRAADEAGRPFDLERPPLFRTGLVRLSANEHLWFIGLHHLIADGTSLRILSGEVMDAYERVSAGRGSPSSGPDVQYGNFVEWQRTRLQSQEYVASLEHWRRALAGVTALNLPTDRKRTSEKTFRGSSETLHVPPQLTEQLRSIARSRGATLYTLLMSAFQVVLARSAGQTDVAIGTAMANRTRPDLEGLVGCVANTVVIRAEVSPDSPFVDLLALVQERVRDAWLQQELPFETLVATLKLREAGRNPLFDAFLAFNVPNPPVTRGGVTLEPVFLKTTAAKFELALFCEDSPDGIRGFLEYQSDLFDAGTVRRILRRFRAVLAGIADGPETPVCRLPLLDDEEWAQLRSRWQASRRPYSRRAALHDLFVAQAHRVPAAIAAADERRAITYEALDRQSTAVANGLRRRGIGPGVVAGLAMERSVNLMVALLGILKSGAAYVPLDPAFPPERLRFLVEDSGASGIVSSFEGPEAQDLRGQLHDVLPATTPVFLLEDLRDQDDADAPIESTTVSPDSLAYILYTSGSTGKPKGVEVTHANVVNFMESMAIEPGLGAQDALLAVTTLSFDIALLELFLPLVVGGRTLIASRTTASDGEKLKAAIVRSGATAMQATPATWRLLLEAGFRPGRNLKVLCGGEALPPDLAAELLMSAPEIWNLYGPTETTIWSTVARLRPGDAPVLGRPIGNTQIYILDRLLQPVPDGVAGEICIGGDGVARGYHQRAELTAERFHPDPFSGGTARLYRTGDVGLMRPDGSLHYLGRGDDQLKVRGFRVEPGEIEAALAGHAGVQEVAVVAERRGPEDVRLIAYVRCDEPVFSSADFRRFLSAALPAYMVPNSFVRLDQLPLTPNGKVDRVALASRPMPALEAPPIDVVAPRTPVEARLAAIWREIIHVEQVGMRDSFFDIGGHSLLAARVIARVQESFGIQLPITLFFASATIEEHGRYIEQALPMTDQGVERLMDWIEGLSDDEAIRYLEHRQGTVKESFHE